MNYLNWVSLLQVFLLVVMAVGSQSPDFYRLTLMFVVEMLLV